LPEKAGYLSVTYSVFQARPFPQPYKVAMIKTGVDISHDGLIKRQGISRRQILLNRVLIPDRNLAFALCHFSCWLRIKKFTANINNQDMGVFWGELILQNACYFYLL